MKKNNKKDKANILEEYIDTTESILKNIENKLPKTLSKKFILQVAGNLAIFAMVIKRTNENSKIMNRNLHTTQEILSIYNERLCNLERKKND